jgi:hypothetical protein
MKAHVKKLRILTLLKKQLWDSFCLARNEFINGVENFSKCSQCLRFFLALYLKKDLGMQDFECNTRKLVNY